MERENGIWYLPRGVPVSWPCGSIAHTCVMGSPTFVPVISWCGWWRHLRGTPATPELLGDPLARRKSERDQWAQVNGSGDPAQAVGFAKAFAVNPGNNPIFGLFLCQECAQIRAPGS